MAIVAVFEWVCLCIGLSFCLSGFVGYRSLAPCCMLLSLIATQKQCQFNDIQRWQNEAQQVARFIRKKSFSKELVDYFLPLGLYLDFRCVGVGGVQHNISQGDMEYNILNPRDKNKSSHSYGAT